MIEVGEVQNAMCIVNSTVDDFVNRAHFTKI